MSQSAETTPEQKATGRQVLWFWLAPLPVALAVGVGIGWLLPGSGAPGQSPAAAPTVTVTATPTGAASGGSSDGQKGAPADPASLARRDQMDPMAVGAVDAPVTMIIYSDFFCQYCARFAEQTWPTLLEDHVQKGELRVEFRDLDIFGDHSQRAALAAYAAGMQHEYLGFHEALFEGGDNPTDEEMSDDGLKATAQRLGLDGDRLLADMDSDEARNRVKENQDEAASIGAFSTPSFLINGEPMVGAQPTEAFVAAITAAKDKQ